MQGIKFLDVVYDIAVRHKCKIEDIDSVIERWHEQLMFSVDIKCDQNLVDVYLTDINGKKLIVLVSKFVSYNLLTSYLIYIISLTHKC